MIKNAKNHPGSALEQKIITGLVADIGSGCPVYDEKTCSADILAYLNANKADIQKGKNPKTSPPRAQFVVHQPFGSQAGVDVVGFKEWKLLGVCEGKSAKKGNVMLNAHIPEKNVLYFIEHADSGRIVGMRGRDICTPACRALLYEARDLMSRFNKMARQDARPTTESSVIEIILYALQRFAVGGRITFNICRLISLQQKTPLWKSLRRRGLIHLARLANPEDNQS